MRCFKKVQRSLQNISLLFHFMKLMIYSHAIHQKSDCFYCLHMFQLLQKLHWKNILPVVTFLNKQSKYNEQPMYQHLLTCECDSRTVNLMKWNY